MSAVLEKKKVRGKYQRYRYRTRITKAVKARMNEKELYRKEFVLREIVDYVLEALKYLTPEQFSALSDEQLKRHVGKLMSEKLMYGMLDDLSPDEMRTFDEAVAEREYPQ